MFEKTREYLKYLIPFTLAVLIYSFITNYSSTVAAFTYVFSTILFMLNRFLVGFTLAYLLNFLVSWLNKTLKMKNWLAILLAYLIFSGAIAAMVIYIIPVMADGVAQIVDAAPIYYVNLTNFVNDLLFMLSPDIRDTINEYIQNISVTLLDFLKASIMDFPSISSAISVSARFVIDIFFGILISVYVLSEKKTLIISLKKFFYAFMKQERAEKIISFFNESNKIFSQFVVGKVLDSLIVGVISLILYLIFGLPLSPFLAIIAALFNMIPYFGPWIGGAITVVILICFSPIHALYSIIISTAIQIIDATFIGPKVVGTMVGISPLLTIIAISIGGDIGGLMGMFFGVPILAVFKILVLDRAIERRLKMKNIKSVK